MPAHSGCCCNTTPTSCCDAWLSCPTTVLVSLSYGWSMTVATTCDWGYIDDEANSCTIPAGTEVDARSTTIHFAELRFDKEQDGLGCWQYSIRPTPGSTQAGTITVSSNVERLACVSCSGGTPHYTRCSCTIDMFDLLDGTVPDLDMCNVVGTITLATTSPGFCKATLILQGDLIKYDAMDSTEYTSGCVASNSSAIAGFRIDAQYESAEYAVASIPCPAEMTWTLVSMTITTPGECGIDTGYLCQSDPTIPLVSPCSPCPADSTCGNPEAWPCYDIDYETCGRFASGIQTDAAICYEESGPALSVSVP